MISNELPGGIDIVHSAGPSPDKRKNVRETQQIPDGPGRLNALFIQNSKRRNLMQEEHPVKTSTLVQHWYNCPEIRQHITFPDNIIGGTIELSLLLFWFPASRVTKTGFYGKADE